jgi:hypothetical protein
LISPFELIIPKKCLSKTKDVEKKDFTDSSNAKLNACLITPFLFFFTKMKMASMSIVRANSKQFYSAKRLNFIENILL